MRHAFVPSVKSMAAEWRTGIRFSLRIVTRSKGGNMKKLFALALLSSCLAIPSFAGDVVGHGVKVAGKDSAKAATVTAKDSAKAVTKVGKFLF
jgi:hypothetical protein